MHKNLYENSPRYILYFRSADSKKATTAISPLCNPSCKVVVTTTPKLTISTQPSHVISCLKLGEVTTMPSRALHTSPLASVVEGGLTTDIVVRKHSKQSLSQPTIPEEGPEDADLSHSSYFQLCEKLNPASVIPQESQDHEIVTIKAEDSTKKDSSSAAKMTGASKLENKKDPTSKQSGQHQEYSKSPKNTRQDSVERLLKAIRGTGRQDSKSKKGQLVSGSTTTTTSNSCPVPPNQSTKTGKKEAPRKNVQEKKDSHKSFH